MKPLAETLVHIRGAGHRYGDITALEDIHLEIARGEFVFLVGPSGAGKSTLLRSLNGQVRLEQGEVQVGNLVANRCRGRQLVELRRQVGVVFQDFKLLPSQTALENMLFALRTSHLEWTPAEARERALQALEAVGLEGREQAFPNQLSGGQQQRLAIARAIAGEPRLLLADEPTGNLDSRNGYEVMAILADVSRWGAAVVVATHNDELVARMGARTVRMEEGRVTEDAAACRELPSSREMLASAAEL